MVLWIALSRDAACTAVENIDYTKASEHSSYNSSILLSHGRLTIILTAVSAVLACLGRVCVMGTNSLTSANCWRLQCRALALVLAAAANGMVVAALRTVLDPNGLPLLHPAASGGLPYDDGSCKDTKPRGWGGLRRVDLIYLVRK